jgi:tRNA-Thr(GGU) m(6)t(6)A37 methyltransferase TsaA
MDTDDFLLRPVGQVESPLTDPADAPRQGDEGAPDAVLVLADEVADAAREIRPGMELLVLTWLHLADRSTQVVHPRGDRTRRPEGVFTTRSPDRPNPVGLHRVRVRGVDGLRVTVGQLEALDGTPIIDVKPVIGSSDER